MEDEQFEDYSIVGKYEKLIYKIESLFSSHLQTIPSSHFISFDLEIDSIQWRFLFLFPLPNFLSSSDPLPWKRKFRHPVEHFFGTFDSLILIVEPLHPFSSNSFLPYLFHYDHCFSEDHVSFQTNFISPSQAKQIWSACFLAWKQFSSLTESEIRKYTVIPIFVKMKQMDQWIYFGMQSLSQCTIRFASDFVTQKQIPSLLTNLSGMVDLFFLSMERWCYSHSNHLLLQHKQTRQIGILPRQLFTCHSFSNKQWKDVISQCNLANPLFCLDVGMSQEPLDSFLIVCQWNMFHEQALHQLHFALDPLTANQFMVHGVFLDSNGNGNLTKLVTNVKDFFAQCKEQEEKMNPQFQSKFHKAHIQSIKNALEAIFEYELESEKVNYFETKTQWIGKSCNPKSLFGLLCVQITFLEQLEDVNTLWKLFLQELRNEYVEKEQFIPHVAKNETPNWSHCIIDQKLQLLNCCVTRAKEWKKYETENTNQMEEGWETLDSIEREDIGDGWENLEEEIAKKEEEIVEEEKERFLSNKFLIHTGEPIQIPPTQPMPPFTEDMILQQQEMLASLGTSREASSLRAKMQGASLISDMESFKYSNPNASFEDFLQYYSPSDITIDSSTTPITVKLSARMQEEGNLWKHFWDMSQARPISQQKPLFDPFRESELCLHYLENLSFDQWFSQVLECIIVIAYTTLEYSLHRYQFDQIEDVQLLLQELQAQIEHTFRMVNAQQKGSTNELSSENLLESIALDDLNTTCQLLEQLEYRFCVLLSCYSHFSVLSEEPTTTLQYVWSFLYPNSFSNQQSNVSTANLAQKFLQHKLTKQEDKVSTQMQEYLIQCVIPPQTNSDKTIIHRMYSILTPTSLRISTKFTTQ